MRNVVACLRVSTDRQGKSGLGIEAQRTAISRFVEAEGMTLLDEHVEIETGKGADGFAANVLPVMRQLQAAGLTTTRRWPRS